MEKEDVLIGQLIEFDEQIRLLKEQRDYTERTLEGILQEQINNRLSKNEYGCGTANLETQSFKIKAVVSKKVTWDQAALGKVYHEIETSGIDPSEYIKRELKVSETAYNGWTDAIKAAFEPARSVEPSKPKITYERKEA
jgi:hypothetical protein